MTVWRKLWLWLPPVVWATTIFWLSSRPTITTSQIYWQDFIIKKSAHFTVYFILAFLVYHSLRQTTGLSFVVAVAVALAVTVAFAVSDETHQSLVPGRDPRLRDVVIDTLGATTAMVYLSRRKSLLLSGL